VNRVRVNVLCLKIFAGLRNDIDLGQRLCTVSPAKAKNCYCRNSEFILRV